MTPWLGFFAPRGVPAPILAKLHAAVNRALADPKVAERRHGGGMCPFISTSDQFQAFIEADHARYGKIVKAAGVKIE